MASEETNPWHSFGVNQKIETLQAGVALSLGAALLAAAAALFPAFLLPRDTLATAFFVAASLALAMAGLYLVGIAGLKAEAVLKKQAPLAETKNTEHGRKGEG